MQAVGRCQSVLSAVLKPPSVTGAPPERGSWGDGESSDSAVTLVAKSVGYGESDACKPPSVCLSSSNEPHRFTTNVLASAKPVAHGKVSVLGNPCPLCGTVLGRERCCSPFSLHFGLQGPVSTRATILGKNEIPNSGVSEFPWGSRLPLLSCSLLTFFCRTSVGFLSIYQNIPHVLCDVACN